jgi:hypothetical protein
LSPATVRPADDARDAGASLVEMVTTVAILGAVMAVVMAGVVAFTRLSGGTEQRMRNLEEARTIMNVVARDLRTATPATVLGVRTASPFVAAEPTRAVFYANQRFTSPGNPTDPTLPVSAAPVRVELRLAADPANPSRSRLIEEVIEPTGSGSNISWPADGRERVIGTNILNTATTGNALFCYDDAARAAAPPTEATFCSTATPALADIAGVRIRLQVQRSGSQGVTVLTSSVWLPNVAAEDVEL